MPRENETRNGIVIGLAIGAALQALFLAAAIVYIVWLFYSSYKG